MILLIVGGIALLVLICTAWCIYASASADDFSAEADWTLWKESTR